MVEGFTEWLPISSTGHLILIDQLIHLDVSPAFMEMFRVVIQLGAILAVVMLYFDRLNPLSRSKRGDQRRVALTLWSKIIVACIPAAILGKLLDAGWTRIYTTALWFQLCWRYTAFSSF